MISQNLYDTLTTRPDTIRAVVIDVLIYYFLYRFGRWLLKPLWYSSPFRKIPGPPASSWFMGNLNQLYNPKGLEFHQHLSDRYGGMVKTYGFFGDEQLYVSDPLALQSIIVKDQDAFEETEVFIETNRVIFGPGLVATTGDVHKRQRKIVAPVFAVPQLKALVPVFYEIAEKLSDVLAREHKTKIDEKTGTAVLDMSEWMSRVALEAVGRTVLGYSFDPLDSPHNNPYTSAIKDLIPTLFSLSLLRQFAPFFAHFGSPSFRRRLVEWTPNRAIQKVKDMSDVMHNTAQKILDEKREILLQERNDSQSGQGENGKAKDIISVLLRANEQAKETSEKLTDAELTGQMTVLIFGAQDTTSSLLSRMLYLLSVNQAVQDKVREEIRAAIAIHQASDAGSFSTRLSYDEVIALPWLDAVIRETLRLFPPVPFVRRTAIKETTLSYSTSSSFQTQRVRVPKGTTLFVGIANANRIASRSVWGSDADEWKPQRWLDDHDDQGEYGDDSESSTRRMKLPGIYHGMLSFLGGGRSCIGYKFAQVEMKILLATLLSKFRFVPAANQNGLREEIVWNLSQIISPSVRHRKVYKKRGFEGAMETVIEEIEEKGLPLGVEVLP